MKPKLVAGILIIIVGIGLAATVLSTIRAQESQPHYKVYNHREWYLQSLWQVHQQTPDSFSSRSSTGCPTPTLETS